MDDKHRISHKVAIMTKVLSSRIFWILLTAASFAVLLATAVPASGDDLNDTTYENLTPEPLNPINNATDVPVTPISFTWDGVVGTVRYKVELYDSDNNLIFSENTISSATGHVYRGTLKYNTTYYWRVIGIDPPGDWSAVSWFTTQKESSVGTGDDAGADNESAVGSMQGPNAAMIIAIVIGALAVILIIAYFALPKKRPSSYGYGQQQGFGTAWKNITGYFQSRQSQQAYVPPPFRCLVCGADNTPGQQFCWDCGSKLPPPPPPSPYWGTPNQMPPQTRASLQTCPRCGDTIAFGEKFCGTCGAAIIGNSTMKQQQNVYREQGPQFPPVYGDPKIQQSAPHPQPYEAQPPPQQQPPGQQQQQGFPCPACGNTVPYGSGSCPACGTQIQW